MRLRATLFFLTVFLWAGQAYAQIPPIQWQILGVGTSDIEFDNPTGELQINVSLLGVGLAFGLGGHALKPASGRPDGGFLFDAALQFRPFMLGSWFHERYRPTFHIFDPHIDVGGIIGTLNEAGGVAFRGVFYVGAVLDFGIPLRDAHLESQILLSVGYRFSPVQSQDGPSHYIVVGIGWRGGI